MAQGRCPFCGGGGRRVSSEHVASCARRAAAPTSGVRSAAPVGVPGPSAASGAGLAAMCERFATLSAQRVSGPREVTVSSCDEAWAAVLTDEARSVDDRKAAYPDRYNPPGQRDYGLKDGAVETRKVRSDEPGPPLVRDYETSTSAGMTMSEARHVEGFLGLGVSGYGKPLVPVGEARPVQHVYRVMSVAEFDQARSRGYIQSDERMNLADEGTVTSWGSTGEFYAPVDGSDYRVVRIQYASEDGWQVDPVDGYIKTHRRVPFDRVDLVTSPLAGPAR